MCALRSLFLLLCALALVFSGESHAYTVLAPNEYMTDGSRGDVNAALGAATDGATIHIPAGTFSWSSGVVISGKGVHIKGAGSGRIVGRSTSAVTIGTGSKTFTTQTGLPLAAGQTVVVQRLADRSRFMEGTVSSYSDTSLTLNVTRVGGSGSADVWIIATNAATTLVQTSSTAPFTVAEDTSHHTEISGICFSNGTAGGRMIQLNHTNGGKHTLIHDCWFRQGRSSLAIDTATNHGLIWNCSFDAEFTETEIGIRGKWNSTAAVADWSTPHTMGMADSTGTRNFYIEDCDFHGYLNAHDFDDNTRLVFRYNLCNNSGTVVHGADTSNHGYRHAEWYNNVFVFNGFPDARTLNVNRWFYIRGATGVITDNVMPDILSGYYGDKPEILLSVMSLRRNEGPYACWGANTPGVQWPVPRQVGQGHDGTRPVRDPFYVWNNSGTARIDVSDFTNQCGVNADRAQDYIVEGFDFIRGPRPGYVKYTYPHPLRAAAGGGISGPPQITVQPQPQTVQVGQAAAFSVAAVGSAPLAYQWQRNGANLAGQNAATLTIGSAQTGDAGAYRCIVSNGQGSATSQEANLTVQQPSGTAPSIVSNPESATVAGGSPVSFSVSAEGTAPLTYQWQRGTANITGAVSQTYSISSVSSTDAGSYRCIVSNAYGSVTSQSASLTVSTQGSGNQYFVDAISGSDQNPGTASSPWRRCPGMAGWSGTAVLQAGDTVYFNRGQTWDVGVPAGSLLPGFELVGGVRYVGNEWNPQGGSQARAILRATARHEAGNVRFWQDHESLPTEFVGFAVNGNGFRSNGIDINHSFWRTGLTRAVKRIRDCVVHGQRGNGSEGDYKYGIIVSDHSPDASGQVANVEILDTTVYDVPRSGIALYPGDRGRISAVTVRGCTVSSPTGDPSYQTATHGITVKGDVRNSTVEYCHVHNVGGAAVFVNGPESGSGPGPSNFAARYSILQSTAAEGVVRIYGSGGKSVEMYGNLILPNSAGGGFNISGNSGTLTAEVHNNTFVRAAVNLGGASGSGTLRFINNIAYHPSDRALDDPAQRLTEHRNNLYFRSAAGSTLVRSGSTSYTSADIGSWEAGVVVADPLFEQVDQFPSGFSGNSASGYAPNGSGLSLRTGSPGVSAGADLGSRYGGSISGEARPAGTAWDLGAYQSPLVARPRKPSNVRVSVQ
jgi:hypothetical protein